MAWETSRISPNGISLPSRAVYSRTKSSQQCHSSSRKLPVRPRAVSHPQNFSTIRCNRSSEVTTYIKNFCDITDQFHRIQLGRCTIMESAREVPKRIIKSSNLVDLPYELIFHLFTLISPNDVLHLLSTCRQFRRHFRDESIWRELSKRYNIRDLLQFPGRTFFGLYTSLLHTYGSLIGLWASDYPFKGNVMEFRFATEHDDWQGIVGEVWRFPRPQDDRAINLPTYWQSVQIRLPDLPESVVPRPAKIAWFIHSEQTNWTDERAQQLFPTFHRFSPTKESVSLVWQRSSTSPSLTTKHPEFGIGNEPWYDHCRSLPRMKVEPSVVADPLLVTDTNLGPILISTPSDTEKLGAISIIPPVRTDPLYLHDPPFPIPDLRHAQTDRSQFPSRYYPLRFPKLVENPTSASGNEEWPLQSLEGIWLGQYGPHGTEVLYIHTPINGNKTDVWKVTGDVNVPRGVITWSFSHSNRISPDSVPLEADFGPLLPSCRIYEGTAHICGTGFVYVVQSYHL